MTPVSSRWKWIAVGAAIVALLVAWQFLPLHDWLRTLEDRIDGLGFLGAVLYAAVCIVGALLFVPGSILGLGAGYLFGVGGGMAVGWVGETAAAALGFLVSRYVARHAVERIARRSRKFAAIDRAVGRNGWKMVGLLRLAAIVPFALSNYIFGLSSVAFLSYMVVTAVGVIPGCFFYVYLGAAGKSFSEKGDLGPLHWAVIGAGVVTSVVMTIVITRLTQKELKKADGVAAKKRNPKVRVDPASMATSSAPRRGPGRTSPRSR